MLSKVRLLPLFVCSLLILSTTAAVAASASPSPCSRIFLRCEKEVSAPPTPGNSHTPASSGSRTCKVDGKTIPCSTGDGVWVDQYRCYLRPADKQPPAPAGKTTGRWYECTLIPGDITGFTGRTFWLDQPPAQIDPARLAREILARIQLQRVGIGITPEPGHTGVLGLPTYLWVNNPGPRTLGPISDSATEGGITVTLTASVGRVVWNLGDGTTITCIGGGTPYRDEFGAQPSPTCGHTYRHPSTELPGGVYRVSATAVWDVAWTGGGQSGQIPFEVTSRTDVRIGEVQALT